MIRPTPDLIARYGAQFLPFRRWMLLLGLLNWFAFYLWDVQLWEHLPVFDQLRTIRLFVIGPLLSLHWLALFLPLARREAVFSAIMGMALLTAWIGLLWMMSVNSGQTTVDQYAPGMLTVLFYHFAFTRQRWTPAAVWSILMIASFNALGIWLWGTSVSPDLSIRWFSSNAYFIVFAAVGTVLCYQLEQAFYLAETQKDEIEAARRRAVSAYRERTDFLMQASHDLRQPMQSIGIFVDLLARSPLPPGPQDTVQRLERAVRSMDDLFRALLDMNRLEAGALTAQPTAVWLPGLIDDELAHAAALAQQRGLQLRQRRALDCWVHTDPALLRRILRNLLVNAILYTRSGGVMVAVRRHGEAHVRLQVIDSGIGIAPDQQQAVFRPFIRLDQGQRGLGLGLAIVQGMAGHLGAELKLRSRLGHGTTFTLALPRQQPPANAQAQDAGGPAHVAPTPRRAGRCIAVVEDDLDILDGTLALLRDAGFDPVGAASGAELLARLQAGDRFPEALVADVELGPETRGWDVLQDLRELIGEDIPAVLMSGSVSPAYRQRAAVAGLPLLQKPFAPAALIETLDDVLRDR